MHATRYTPDTAVPGDPDKLFKEALVYIRRNEPNRAACALKQALKVRPQDPHYLSYLGVCLAMIDKQATEAAILCEEAAEEVCCDALLYCNLGKVHLLLGNRGKAHAAFRSGLAWDRDNRHILRELRAMGARKKTVFSFLSRGHVLNRLAGRLRHLLRRPRA
jgi:predicted Zn-dependent protease